MPRICKFIACNIRIDVELNSLHNTDNYFKKIVVIVVYAENIIVLNMRVSITVMTYERHGVPNQQRLFRLTSKKISKPCVIMLWYWINRTNDECAYLLRSWTQNSYSVSIASCKKWPWYADCFTKSRAKCRMATHRWHIEGLMQDCVSNGVTAVLS